MRLSSEEGGGEVASVQLDDHPTDRYYKNVRHMYRRACITPCTEPFRFTEQMVPSDQSDHEWFTEQMELSNQPDHGQIAQSPPLAPSHSAASQPRPSSSCCTDECAHAASPPQGMLAAVTSLTGKIEELHSYVAEAFTRAVTQTAELHSCVAEASTRAVAQTA